MAFVQQLEAIRPGISEKIYPLSILNEAALFIAYGVRWVLPYAGWMSVDLRPPFPLGFTALAPGCALLYVGLGQSPLGLLLQRRDIWSAVGLFFTLFPVLWYVTEFSRYGFRIRSCFTAATFGRWHCQACWPLS